MEQTANDIAMIARDGPAKLKQGNWEPYRQPLAKPALPAFSGLVLSPESNTSHQVNPVHAGLAVRLAGG